MKTSPSNGFLVLSVFASVLSAALTARAETWGDRTGDVVIPAETTVEIGEDDLSALASATSITIGDGALVVYTAASPATLSMPISGTGSFVAKDAGALTLAADNSGLVSPGHFSFTNTKAIITHEYGLGGKETASAFFHIDNAYSSSTGNGDTERLSNYSPVFDTSRGPFTNHVDIACDTRINLGSESNETAFVMDASLFWEDAASHGGIFVKGFLEFVGDAVLDSNGKHFYISKPGGYSKGIMKFSGSSRLKTSYFFGGGATVYFNSDGEHKASCLTGSGAYFAGCAENTLPNIPARFYTQMTIDLGGYNQRVRDINFTEYAGGAINEGGASSATLTSGAPAKLRLTGDQADATWALCVTGAAGIQFDSGHHVTMVNRISDSTGEFAISKGTFEFKWNAGWSDGTMTITGGTVIASSAMTMASGKTKLLVGGTGKLLVADGVNIRVSEAVVGDVKLEVGKTYTLPELDALGLSAYVAAADGAAGTGTLEVYEWVEWTGWPEEAGADVTVPPTMEIVVGDEDLARVLRCGSITLESESALKFSGLSEPFVFDVPLAGMVNSSVTYADGVYAVLLSDNSAFLGKSLVCAGSTVVVSNRYGLGCAETAAAVAELGGELLFGGPGLTNDVPLDVTGDKTGTWRIHANKDGGTFVQNSKFTLRGGQGPNLPFENTVFNGPFITDGASSPTLTIVANRSVVANAGLNISSFMILNGHGRFVIGAGGNKWERLHDAYSGVQVVCGAQDVFPDGREYAVGFTFSSPNGGLDLGGFDQEISHFINVYGTVDAANAAKGCHYPVSSDEPATLTLTQTSTDVYTVAPRFLGQASLRYAGNGTLEILGARSSSSGTLTVSSGTVRFAEDAGWGGDVLVDGGRLVIDSDWGIRNVEAVVTVTSGTIELPAGRTIIAKKIIVDGKEISASGEYTAGSLAGMGITSITGGGSITVGSQRDVYVDPENGSDQNDGFSRDTPKKTLAAASAVASSAGMVIHAAPGVYSNGYMVTEGSYEYSAVRYDETNRVVVAPGVTLVSDEGPDVTFIEGARSSAPKTGSGCGLDSVRCVFLRDNAEIRGFTIRNGSTVSTVNGASAYGAGVFTADKHSKTIDCVISNCYSYTRTAGYGGNYLRCRIAHNTCINYAAGLAGAGVVANCVFEGNGAYCLHELRDAAVNCTIMPNSRYNATIHQANKTVYNSLIGGSIGPQTSFKNCIFTEISELASENSTAEDSIFSSVAANALDASCRPVYGSSVCIDNAKARACYEEIVVPVFGEEEASLDFAGGQRIYNGALDIGAGEFDWRGRYRKDISRRVVVDGASSDVVESADGKVRIEDGATLALVWKNKLSKPSETSFEFKVAGGTLAVTLNGEAAGTLDADGRWAYPGGGVVPSGDDKLEFTFTASEEGGYAELQGLVHGFAVILR